MQTIALFHAVDSDGSRLTDRFGEPLVVRKVGKCNCQRMEECQDAATGETLWFFKSSLRPVQEPETRQT